MSFENVIRNLDQACLWIRKQDENYVDHGTIFAPEQLQELKEHISKLHRATKSLAAASDIDDSIHKVATFDSPSKVRKRRKKSGAYDFMIIELIDEFRRRGRSTLESELFPALSLFDEIGSEDTLKTKLNDMKKAGIIDWPPREPANREVTPNGREERKTLWKEAVSKKDRIQGAIRSVVGESYCFPVNI